MHSHIWFHHVSPCPAVSPRRWAGHHPVRHPVQGSQTASEWLIINPGSLRPPNKNLNRPPKKKNSNKNWMVTLNCQASSSPNQVGANIWTIWDPRKRPSMAPAFFCWDGLAFRRCLCLSIDFLDGIMLPLKNVGDCHDPRSRRSYYMTSQYQATTPGFEHCSRHFVGPFFGGKCVFQDSIPNIPMLGSHSSFFGSSSQPSIT